MSDRKLIIVLIVLAVITFISSIVTIVGFITLDAMLVINSARVLSITSLILMTVFGRSVYLEMFDENNVREVRMELHSKEDVEEFRRKLEKELQKYIKQIAEEEELDKDKDE